jgi:RNA polymerase sigma-70 factor (ECF subfamily)
MDDMAHSTALPPPQDDVDLVRRIGLNDQSAFESLMRQHNGRLFRVARAILKDDAEAEDALQDAYLDAFRHISAFRGESQLSTWLVRIVANQALMRLRRQRRQGTVVPFTHDTAEDTRESPTAATLRAETRQILERRIDELPVAFRTVFILREVEEMSVEQTADALGIPAATVRSRLFRARALLRAALARDIDMATGDVFGFAGARCDRIVAAVLARRERNDTSLHRM